MIPSLMTHALTRKHKLFLKDMRQKNSKNHLVEEVLGDIEDGIRTRMKHPVNYREMVGNVCFVSKIEPKNVTEAIVDEYLISVMQEELVQFERNDVWELVPKPKNKCYWN